MEKEMKKKEQRAQAKAAMALCQPEYCREADREIIRRVTEREEYQKADVFFCFVGTPEEINTEPLIQDALRRGKRVGVPLCTGAGQMEVREIRGLEELRPGRYGIREPQAQAPLIRPEEIDLTLVPCLSCSRDGRRLGHGGGYYDRFLSKGGGVRLVVCRGRLMREDIEEEPHDVKMDLVVWEGGTQAVKGAMNGQEDRCGSGA